MAHPQHESVRRAFQYRCGYCGVEESEAGSELTVDHYHPRSEGGTNDLENLVYACHKCNQYKGEYWPSKEDEAAGQYVLHPQRHNVSIHFREDEVTGELRPFTQTGEFHLRLLHLNRPPLVACRLARQGADLLRRRIRLMEEQIEQREEAIHLLNDYIATMIESPVGNAEPQARLPLQKTSVLAAEGLRKSYRKRTVVNNVSLDIRQNEIVGLLGPNGAGKTTVFYMIVGLERPDAGKIFLDLKDISRLPMYLRARDGISYLPQEASVFRKLTVEENILLVLQTLPLTKAERAHRLEVLLDELDIAYVRHTKAYQLSGGERRRTEIARCLVIEPRFIMLDEPFAGIDPIAVIDIQQILQKLRDRGIGVLITDHNVRETLAITDRAYIINDGKIFRAGTPDELTRDEEVKRVYLGENFRM